MSMLSIANYDMCVGCKEVCATCWKAGKHDNFDTEYPLDIESEDKDVQHTYDRWFKDNLGSIRCFVRENFDDSDWNAQMRWMKEHARVAYSQLDNHYKDNDAKIARIISWLWSLDFGNIPILGGQQLGKTLTMLWIAENMHAIKPKKPICYFTNDMNREMPDWMTAVDDLGTIPNGALVPIDEAALRAFAGDHAKSQMKWMTKWIAVIGHKRLIVLLPTQSLNILGINPVRLMTGMIIKPISDVAAAFGERDLIDMFKYQLPTMPFETTVWNPRPPGKFLVSFWQPMPRFDHDALRLAFSDYDVTKDEKLFKISTIQKVRFEEVTCCQCFFKWRPRMPNPARCPKCGSKNWDKVSATHTVGNSISIKTGAGGENTS